MIVVALAGNPNCGKTTLFNALTGSRHHVGNWAGVTVEKRSGQVDHDGLSMEVVDLPGTYSLSAKSEDERIAAHFLSVGDATGQLVDVLVNVLDASNLERNLYLTTQLLELKKPMVFILNMWDDAEAKGIAFDIPTLETLLGGPVIPTVGNREEGIAALKDALVAVAKGADPRTRPIALDYGHDIEGELTKIGQEINKDEHLDATLATRWLALQLLEGSPEGARLVSESHARKAIEAQVQASLAFVQPHLGDDGATLVAERRYGFAHGLVSEVQTQPTTPKRAFKERLDTLLTHRRLGLPVFFLIMVAVYTLTFVIGKYPQDWILEGFARLKEWTGGQLPPGELSSLLTDGIITGVGSVLSFVPVIMLLMGCIAFLEDTGYMARAAFIMDRLMHLMGLHGKSFIPLIMGTGCNVPAVQATRTIESREDRFITILVAPLVSCSARLQVFILIAGSFFTPFRAALAIFAMQILGFGLAIVAGRVLKSTLFRGTNAPFVMELPPYRMPVLKSSIIHMWEKGSVFLTQVGTTILAGATLVWFLSNYPGISNKAWDAEFRAKEQAVQALAIPAEAKQSQIEDLQLAHQSRIMNSSLAAQLGKRIQPSLAPIFDPDHNRPEAWKDVIALTAGFAAKEIVVSTMAVIHQAKAGEPDAGQTLNPLQEALRNRSGMTALTALAFMVFTLIYTPCLGTVGMIKKETGSWGWTGFSVGYSMSLAWILAWATVVLGRMMGFA